MIKHSDERVRAANAEFDCPFMVGRSGAVHGAAPRYIPKVTHDDEHDILLDGVPHKQADAWEVFSIGYTGQHGYNGGVMHPSEYLGLHSKLLDDVMDNPGTYVIVAVEVEPTDDDPEPAPAGWTILKLKEST